MNKGLSMGLGGLGGLLAKRAALVLDVGLIADDVALAGAVPSEEARIVGDRFVDGVEAVEAIEAEPPAVVAGLAARLVGLREGETAVDRDAVQIGGYVAQAVPRVAGGYADVAAAEAERVLDDGPSEAEMFAGGQNQIGSIDGDGKAHGQGLGEKGKRPS
jgi:hypothetical protein